MRPISKEKSMKMRMMITAAIMIMAIEIETCWSEDLAMPIDVTLTITINGKGSVYVLDIDANKTPISLKNSSGVPITQPLINNSSGSITYTCTATLFQEVFLDCQPADFFAFKNVVISDGRSITVNPGKYIPYPQTTPSPKPSEFPLTVNFESIDISTVLNSVESITYNIDGKSDHTGSNAISKSYSDGLGRELQSQSKVNGTSKAIVSGTYYDEAGRPVKSVKPFPYTKSTDNLDYVIDDLIDGQDPGNPGPNSAKGYYNGTNGPDAGGYPYSETQYYDDPLGRVKATGASGLQFSLHRPAVNNGVGEHAVRQWSFGVTLGADGHIVGSDPNFQTNGLIVPSRLNNDLTTIENTAMDDDATANHNYMLSITKTPFKDGRSIFSQTLTDLSGKTIRSSTCGDGAKNVVTESEYDIMGNMMSETPPATDHNISRTSYTYNTLGQLISKSTPDAGTIDYFYDDDGRLWRVRDCQRDLEQASTLNNRNAFLEYGYDDLGRQVTVTAVSERANSTVTPDAIKIRTVYDDPALARSYLKGTAFITSTNPTIDDVITSLNNTNGRVVAIIAYDESFSFIGDAEYDYTGKTIELFSYDDDGRVKKKYTTVPGVPVKIADYEYDDLGKITRETLSFINNGAINASNNIITNYSYDANGRLKEIVRDGYTIVSYNYDDLGRMTTKTYLKKQGTATTLNFPIIYTYNISEWITSINSPGDKFKEALFYDKDATTSPSGAFSALYNGNISRATYATSISSSNYATIDQLYEYDGLNRLTYVDNINTSDANGEFDSRYTYADDGRITEKHEGPAQDNWGTYDYCDNTNRLKGIQNSNRDGTNYLYDNNGNMIWDQSKAMAIKYDWRDLPVEIMFCETGTTVIGWWHVDYISSQQLWKRKIKMTYDASGNRVLKEEVKRTIAGQQTLAGLPSAPAPRSAPPSNIYAAPAENAPASSILIAKTGIENPLYAITPDGRIQSSLPITQMTAQDEIPENALTMTDVSTGQVNAAFSEAGYFTRGIMVDNNTAEAETGSLLGEQVDPPAPCASAPISFAPSSGSLYLAGDMKNETKIDGVAYVGGTVFTYNSNTEKYEFSYTDLAGIGTERFTVDADNNITNRKFQYNLTDHLGSTRAVISEDEIIKEAYAYKPYGSQVELVTPIASEKTREQFTTKELDGARPGTEIQLDVGVDGEPDGGTLQLYFSDGTMKELNGINQYGSSYCMWIQTLQFDIPMTVTGAKIISNTRGTYQTAGFHKTANIGEKLTLSWRSTDNTGTIENDPAEWTETIGETSYMVAGEGLYYFGRRYYDPEIGAFTSTDPEGQSWNAYDYCGGDPINFTDPDGAFFIPPQILYPLVTGSIGFVAGGLIGGAFDGDPNTSWSWGGAAIGGGAGIAFGIGITPHPLGENTGRLIFNGFEHGSFDVVPQMSPADQLRMCLADAPNALANFQIPASASYTFGDFLLRPLNLVPPVANTFQITSNWGFRIHPRTHIRQFHPGIDLANTNGATTGAPIQASQDGVVTLRRGGPGGNEMIITGDDGFQVTYSHLQRFAVGNGARVEAGQTVGYVGNTGRSTTGPHLHLGTRVGGQRVNPNGYFQYNAR